MSHAHLFIITAPSGAGKTSLIKSLLESDSDIQLSTSHTTRPPRVGEQTGKDYFFVDKVRFEAMIEESGFLEYAEVFGNYYGTSRNAVNDVLKTGQDVILEIDVQGAHQVRQLVTDCRWIFILPPSKTILHERLTHRGTDSSEVIARRTAEAVNEMSQYHLADYIIINDDFKTALDQLHSIFKSERLRTPRQQHRIGSSLKDLTE